MQRQEASGRRKAAGGRGRPGTRGPASDARAARARAALPLRVNEQAFEDIDGALEDYRAATTPDQRAAARRAVAERLAALRVVAVVRAPTHVMLVSRRVRGLELVDDMPRLSRLRLRPLETWILGQRAGEEPS